MQYMDYQKLLEKYGGTTSKPTSSSERDVPSLSTTGIGARSKTPKSHHSDVKKSSTSSKPDSEEVGDDDPLPGFVIEFRLSKAYQCLQKQEKDVSLNNK